MSRQGMLGTNGILDAGERLLSPDGTHALVLHRNGKLVVQRETDPGKGTIAWESPNAPGDDGDHFLEMQEDGNLVIYRGTPSQRQPLWAAPGFHEGTQYPWWRPDHKGKYVAALWDDGNLATYVDGGTVWSNRETGRVPHWQAIPDTAHYDDADWSTLVRKAACRDLDEAKSIALADPQVGFFFYCRQDMLLTRNGRFSPGEAVFFRGPPWPGSAPQCDIHVKWPES